MYELSVRHAIAKPVIIIAEEGTRIPFDIISQRTIFYNTHHYGLKPLQEKIKEVIKNIEYTDWKNNPIGSTILELRIFELPEIQENEFRKYVINKMNSILCKIDSLTLEKEVDRTSEKRVKIGEKFCLLCGSNFAITYFKKTDAKEWIQCMRCKADYCDECNKEHKIEDKGLCIFCKETSYKRT